MLEKVPGVGAVRRWLYLAAKTSHVGINVDGIACPLHRRMAYSRQTRGQGLLLAIVLSCHYSERWRLSGDVKPPKHRYLMEC
jgi:hypothetical protein